MFVPQATDNSEILQYIHTPLSIIIRFDSGVSLGTIRTNPITIRFTVILRCIVNLTHTVRVYIIRNETPTYSAPSSPFCFQNVMGTNSQRKLKSRDPARLDIGFVYLNSMSLFIPCVKLYDMQEQGRLYLFDLPTCAFSVSYIGVKRQAIACLKYCLHPSC